MKKLVDALTLVTAATVALVGQTADAQVEPPPGLITAGYDDRVEIAVPPAPNGSQPSVAIAHAHQVTDGPLGSGFRLLATSSITRHSATGGVPLHGVNGSESTFRLDDQLLYGFASGSNLPEAAVGLNLNGYSFQPEIYSGDFLSYDEASNTWTRVREGWTWVYGETSPRGHTKSKTEPVIAGGDVVGSLPITCAVGGTLCSTSEWFLSSVTDPAGNTTTFDYRVEALPSSLGQFQQQNTEEVLLSAIRYASDQVVISFSYDDRPEPRASLEDGITTFHTQRLRTITVKVGTSVYSKYRLSYEDDGGTDTPTQSLLTEVTREAADGTSEIVLRSYTHHHGGTAFAWDLTTVGTPLEEDATTIAADLNGDAVSDLVALSYKRLPGGTYVSDHRVYIATPGEAQAFVSATEASGDTLDLIQAFETTLNLYLTYEQLSQGRGLLVGDLNRNGWVDFLIEEVPPSGLKNDLGDVVIIEHLGGDNLNAIPHSNLPACALRFAELVDINGDGYPDLVRKEHDESGPCAERNNNKWVENLGARPYVEWARRVDLALPAINLAVITATCPTMLPGFSTSLKVDPFDPNSAADRQTNYSHFGDFNGDGVTDIAYSFYTCFELDENIPANLPSFTCPVWRAQQNSLYSRIFYGSGDGTFVNSGLEAGPPHVEFDALVTSEITCSQQVHQRLTGPIDLDRSGFPDLVSGLSPTYLVATHSRGAVEGFTSSTGAPDIDGSPFQGDLDDKPAVGDFDGDGFVDFVMVTTYGIGVYGNTRATSEGRVERVKNAVGGETFLGWGFSASGENENPELKANIEVLESVRGETGTSTIRYADGDAVGTQFRGFGQIEVTNARGARTEHGFYTDYGRRGRPSYGARYREDGTLEHVTVFIQGVRSSIGSYSTDIVPPLTTTLLRQCDYDIGRDGLLDAPPTLDALIEQCHTFGEGGMVLVPETWDRPLDDLPPAWWDRSFDQEQEAQYCPRDPEYGKRLGSDTEPVCRPLTLATLTKTAVAKQDIAAAFLEGLVVGPLYPFPVPEVPPDSLRWPVPPDISLPPEPEPGVVFRDAYTLVRAFITDYFYDTANQRLDRVYDHRDTATVDDDLETTLTFDQPASAYPWYRLTERLIQDRSGATWLSEQRLDFDPAHFDRSQRFVSCGRVGAGCTETLFEWNPDGSMRSKTFADGTSRSWTYAWCGREETSTDEAGRVRTKGYDALCRETSESFLGATTTRSYDAYNRVVTQANDPGLGQPGTTLRTFYEDAPGFVADKLFDEPRRAHLRESDGRLTLEYLDEYSRPTRVEVCQATSTSATSIDDLACASAPIVQKWNAYTVDGQVAAVSAAFGPGETSPTLAFTRDGWGRITIQQTPGHETTPSWETSYQYLSPGRKRTIDALGRTQTELQTTLSSEVMLYDETVYREERNAFGLVVAFEELDGQRIENVYDDGNRLVESRRAVSADCWQGAGASAVYGPCDQGKLYGYDSRNRLVSTTNLNEFGYEVELDGVGRTLAYRHVDGPNRTTLSTRTYDDAVLPRVHIEIDEAGNEWRGELDGTGRTLTRSVSPPGGGPLLTQAWSYDAEGRLAGFVDERGLSHAYEYDYANRRVAEEHPSAGRVDYELDGAGRILAATDADSIRRTFQYTFAGKPAEAELGGRLTHQVFYDAAGRRVGAVRDSVESAIVYDDFDRVTRIEHGIDPVTGAPSSWIDQQYDAQHRMIARQVGPVAGTFASEAWSYDPWGRVDTYTTRRGAPVHFEYNASGLERFYQDETGYRRETRYDARGRVVSRDVPGADPITLRYTAGAALPPPDGRAGLFLTETIDGDGYTSLEYTDALGRVVQSSEPDGTSVAFDYAPVGPTTKTWYDAAGTPLREVRYEYEALTGRLSSEVGPTVPGSLGPAYSTGYEYTAGGRLAAIHTPGSTTTYTYDAVLGLLESESYDGLTRTVFREGSTVLPTRTELAGGASIRHVEYTRDAAGRTTEVLTHLGDPLVNGERTAFGPFNAYGQPEETRHYPTNGVQVVGVRWGYALDGRVASRETWAYGGSSGVTSWSYYANGVVESVTTPSGARFEYDFGPRFDYALDRVVDGAGTVYAEVRARNGRGQVLEMNTRSDTRVFGYDALGRVTGRDTLDASGAVLSSWSGTFDALGKLTQEDFSDAAGASWTNEYTYDEIGRLVREVHDKSDTVIEYVLDLAGNRLETRADGPGGLDITTFTYSGNLLTAVDGAPLTYNDFNEVVVDQRGHEYLRLSSGLIDSVRASGSTVRTFFARDADGLPVASLRLEAGTAEVTHTHWGLDPSGLPLEVAGPNGELTRYVVTEGELVERLHDDGSGIVTGQAALADEGGTLDSLNGVGLGDATAFGAGAVPPPGSNERFLFQRMESLADVPGVHFSRLRAYDPETGRFLSPDPSGLKGGAHRYAYVAGDPVNFNDAMGLEPVIIGNVALDLPASSLGMFSNFGGDFSLEDMGDLDSMLGVWDGPGICMGEDCPEPEEGEEGCDGTNCGDNEGGEGGEGGASCEGPDCAEGADDDGPPGCYEAGGPVCPPPPTGPGDGSNPPGPHGPGNPPPGLGEEGTGGVERERPSPQQLAQEALEGLLDGQGGPGDPHRLDQARDALSRDMGGSALENLPELPFAKQRNEVLSQVAERTLGLGAQLVDGVLNLPAVVEYALDNPWTFVKTIGTEAISDLVHAPGQYIDGITSLPGDAYAMYTADSDAEVEATVTKVLDDMEQLASATAEIAGTVIAVGKGAKLAKSIVTRGPRAALGTPGCAGGACGVPGGQCFVAGTPVLTPDGTVPIEEIEIGDLVLSRDPTTGETTYKRVVWLKDPHQAAVLSLSLADDEGDEDTLQVTGEHPFWVRGRGWVPAGELAPGDEIYTAHGGWLRVGSSTWAQARATVYNFEVEDFHTYFVGESGAWVHNTCPIPGNANGEFSRWFDRLSPDEFDEIWSNPQSRKTIKRRLRSPGGQHEWLLVSRANVFKRWGATTRDIMGTDMRSPTAGLRVVNPPGIHGGPGATTFHNELLGMIDSSMSMGQYLRRLRMWANYRLPNGVSSLPSGLQ